MWTPIDEVESIALNQLKNIASLPWVYHHVAVMPDVHYGIGATVGSVIAMKDAVCPAAVGVDIGCGMAAIRLNKKASDLPDSLSEIRHNLERKIPVGHYEHTRLSEYAVENKRLWKEFDYLDKKVQKLKDKAIHQTGTLGGGNHFIELCLDTDQNVWLMLHSGSRNIGKTLAEIHIGIARKLAHNQQIIDRDLAVFLSNTIEMEAYQRDLTWAQEYALFNRSVMLKLCMNVFKKIYPDIKVLDEIQCHHNYMSEEIHFGEKVYVTRKGAIRAQKNEMGIIPGSMGTKSYIVRGLGNQDSFQSASHGAGRRMSRGDAKRKFTLTDLTNATMGVECRKDSGVLDEIPMAYKDIDQVIENQKDLVLVVSVLKQILCIKG